MSDAIHPPCSKPLSDEDLEDARRHLHYDPETGIFTWKLNPCVTLLVGQPAGSMQHGYLRIGFKGKKIKAHRLAWLFTTGEWPMQMIDHINGNRADNRIANLRIAPGCMNAQNQRAAQRSNKSTGLLGTSFHKVVGRYAAAIRADGERIHLGFFDTAQEAHEAYVAAKRKFHIGGVL